MVAQLKPQEPLADILFRLLQKARVEGVEIVMDGFTEQHYATSGTMPNIIYAVSESGCGCQGYKSFGRCKHFALYLEQFGLRPPTESEIEEARAEWARMSALLDRLQIKSTGDWRNLQRAKRTYERVMKFGAAAGAQPTALAAD